MSTDKPLNILVAYPYCSNGSIKQIKEMKNEFPNSRFLLDSGAFTAFNANKVINVDDYCRFIESLPIEPWRYFTLDVIGDFDGTMKNYEIMKKRGFNPLPVFTHGEGLSVLDDFFDTSDMVGVGGLVGLPSNMMLKSVYQIQKRAAGRKTHLLGFTRLNHVKKLQPYSCDSSSWESAGRFGTGVIYTGKGNFEKIDRSSIINRPSDRLLRLIREHNIDIKELTDEKKGWRGGASAVRRLSAAAWVKCCVDVEKNINTKMFLACTTSQAISQLRSAHRYEVKK